MPRENSFSDSEGRSLTPDLSDDEGNVPLPTSPTYSTAPRATSPVRSHRSQARSHAPTHRSHAAPTHAPAHITPKDRFRASVRKIMAMHRSTTLLSRGPGYELGAEPGIDPRRESTNLKYQHIHEECVIEVADYSSLRASFGRMTNESFLAMLRDDKSNAREPWVKVRWINIAGISWDVLSALALKYELHPLALEDILHQRDQNRSKADYYAKHLFLRVLCHHLGNVEDADSSSPFPDPASRRPPMPSAFASLPRSSSPPPFTSQDANGLGEYGSSSGYEEKNGYGEEKEDPATERRKSKSRTWRRRNAPGATDVERGASRFGTLATIGTTTPGTMLSTRTAVVDRNLALEQEEAALARATRRAAQDRTINELKKGERVNVKVAPMFIFLFRDGTVISLRRQAPPSTPAATGAGHAGHNCEERGCAVKVPTHQKVDFTEPIMKRLRQTDTLLRKSADPSMLVQSLLDLIVDQAMEVIDEYHDKIKKFERDILLKPKMKTVRYLHILSGDLILHKRTLEPIKTVIYGLRRYDLDRCAALLDSSVNSAPVSTGLAGVAKAAADADAAPPKVVGFMSHKAKIYLADVHDHMEYILTSLEMFAGISENLIDYTFNMASYEMNEVMRRLTLATIIFLPLTLLTGYFGMNFSAMWSVDKHTDALFWYIAIPVMAIVIPMFTAPDLSRVWHYIQKKMLAKKAVKTLKQS
ncbi:hypothetical protein HGRIS_008654 [Hohenbuehelia grisea]|uniref:Uncharacterized protein n=1 Tax=Hohenbuehelia grisea TaxID=104357 RepID=A0ABR3J938_9AGAR